jgi:glycosyltransferase involved in cell wall biosynthesis
MSRPTMRIAIVRLAAGGLFDTTDGTVFGGAEVRAWTFAQGLAQDPFTEVQFIVHGKESRQPEIRAGVRIRRVEIRRRSEDRRWGWELLWQIPHDTWTSWSRSLRARRNSIPTPLPVFQQLNADVIATFGLHDPSASVIQSARSSGKRSVLFLTSDRDTERAIITAEKKQNRTLARHRYAIAHADLVVAQTDRQRQLVASTGVPVIRIRNPIDTRVSECDPQPPETRRYVLWVGRADTDCKRADLCWQLARNCPEVPFVAVMNPQSPELTESLRQSVPPNVRLIERVSWEASDALYRDALLLLNTSESEGFPNAFLQAAKHGVPVFSRRVDPDGVLSREGIGWVAHDDLHQLAMKIRTAHAHPRDLEGSSRAARRYVTTYHDAGQCVTELREALNALAGPLPFRHAA